MWGFELSFHINTNILGWVGFGHKPKGAEFTLGVDFEENSNPVKLILCKLYLRVGFRYNHIFLGFVICCIIVQLCRLPIHKNINNNS